MTAADLISKFIDKLPLLFFMGVAFWCACSADDDASTPSEEAVGKLYEQHVVETQRVNATLERIAAILEKRPLA